MTILSELDRSRPTCAASPNAQLERAGRRDPRDDHLDRRRDRRPSRFVARRRRAHDRPPPAARIAARPDRLGHRPPGLPAQAADRPTRAIRDAPPARRRRWLPAALRVAPRRLRWRSRRAPGCRSPRASPTARDLRHGMERIAVVVGDAALMSGLSLEALNDIGQRKTQMLIVLNDNEMSISPTVGALLEVPLADQALERLAPEPERLRPIDRARAGRRPAPRSSCRAGCALGRPASRSRASCSRTSGSPTSGSCPGHDLRALSETLGAALELPGPAIVHVRTQKGRGYRPAETDQVGFHGAALPPMQRHARRPTPTTARSKAPAGPCRPNRWRTTPPRRRPSPPRPRRTRTTRRSSRPS